MEVFLEELRTPPVSLISLVGCLDLHPTISAFLHSGQPPINTLALPDFSKISILSKKMKDPLDSGQSALKTTGILKRDWLLKHRSRVPAVAAAMFSSDDVSGDPVQWLQVCTDLDNLKVVVRGRNIKLVVVLVQRTTGDGVREDLMIALRKRAEIESKYLVQFVQDDASELRQSLNRLAGLFAELCNTYYREEGRKIKTRIDKKTAELHVRYCFKVVVYAEFRRDWAEALRFFEDAYHAVCELSAHYLREKRYCLDCTLSMIDSVGGNPESVIPSTFVGQSARLYEEGDYCHNVPPFRCRICKLCSCRRAEFSRFN